MLPFMTGNKKKKKEKINKIQKGTADDNRGSAGKLIAELQKTPQKASHLNDDEACASFCKMSKLFIENLNNTKTIASFDIAEMDAKLLTIMYYYNEAIENGDLETAKLCVDTIHKGISEYRKELEGNEIEKSKAVIDERMESLETQLAKIRLSVQLFSTHQDMMENQKQYDESREEYVEVRQKLKEQRAEDPILYEKIANKRETDALPPGDNVPEMHNNILKLRAFKYTVENLNVALRALTIQYEKTRESLATYKMMDAISNPIITKQDEVMLTDAINVYQEKLKTINHTSVVIDKILDSFHTAMLEIGKDPDIGAMTTKAAEVVKQIEEEEMLAAESKAAGRKLASENRQRATLTN